MYFDGMKAKKGFTLVELSIVIVIIGLIVAGVVGGQALVRQSKLRTIVSDYNAYEVALNTFRLEYSALPGDMANAHDYWNGCNSGATANECNGNGNNSIQWGGNNAGNESTRAWQHLNLADILPGSYIGSSDPNGAEIGLNVPKASYDHCGYWFWNGTGRQVYIILGAVRADASGILQAGCLSGLDMQNIDKKLEDGIKTSGRLTGGNGMSPNVACTYGEKNPKRCVPQFIPKK